MENLFNEIEILTETMKPKKKGLGERMRDAMDNGGGAVFEVQIIDPEYKKKLNAATELPDMGYEAIRHEIGEYIKLYIHNYRKKWTVSEENKQAYRTITQILSDQLQYIMGSSDIPPKSIMLHGESGKGKSTIMKEFMRSVVISKYRKLVPILPAEKIGIYKDSLLKDHIVFIDDLGLELNSTRDETGAFISKDELASRTFTMLNHRRKNNLITNVTTNLSLTGMIELYGARSAWRFDEMWEAVEIK